MKRIAFLAVLSSCQSYLVQQPQVQLEGVPPPTVTMFEASATELGVGGGEVTLSWAVTGANVVVVGAGVGETRETTATVMVTQTTTIDLAAANSAGSDVAAVTITVEQPPPSPPKVEAFSVNVPALPYGGGEVVLSWDTSFATAVTLQPLGLDVSGSNFITLSVTTPTTFTLHATSEHGSDDSELFVDVSRTTEIHGRIITERGEQPIVGAKVGLASGGAVVVTDDNGEFTLGNIEPPYDLAAATEDGLRATVYRGLSVLEPILQIVGTEGLRYEATVTGHVAINGAGNAPDNTLVVLSSSRDGLGDAFTQSGNYSANGDAVNSFTRPRWYGQPWIEMSLMVFSMTAPVKFGQAVLTLADEGTFSNVNLSLDTQTNVRIEGTCTPPSGYTINSVRRGMDGPVGAMGAATNPFDFNVPLAPDTRYSGQVRCEAQKTGETNTRSLVKRAGFRADALALSLAPPAVMTRNSPPASSTIGPGTFSDWTAAEIPSPLYMIETDVGANEAIPRLSVVTAALSDVMPNLTHLGFSLQAATAYSTRLRAYDNGSIQTIAAMGTLSGYLQARPTNLVYLQTANRTVMTP